MAIEYEETNSIMLYYHNIFEKELLPTQKYWNSEWKQLIEHNSYAKQQPAYLLNTFKKKWISITRQQKLLKVDCKDENKLFKEKWFTALAYIETIEHLRDCLATETLSSLMKRFKFCNLCAGTAVIVYECGQINFIWIKSHNCSKTR